MGFKLIFSVEKGLVKSDKEILRKIVIQTQDVDLHRSYKERTASKKKNYQLQILLKKHESTKIASKFLCV